MCGALTLLFFCLLLQHARIYTHVPPDLPPNPASP
jgi:hypothetical protein